MSTSVSYDFIPPDISLRAVVADLKNCEFEPGWYPDILSDDELYPTDPDTGELTAEVVERIIRGEDINIHRECVLLAVEYFVSTAEREDRARAIAWEAMIRDEIDRVFLDEERISEDK